MDQQATLDDLDRRIKAIGSNMADICKAAGVAPSTPSRWRAGTVGMTFATLEKLNRAIAERAAVAPAERAA